MLYIKRILHERHCIWKYETRPRIAIDHEWKVMSSINDVFEFQTWQYSKTKTLVVTDTDMMLYVSAKGLDNVYSFMFVIALFINNSNVS